MRRIFWVSVITALLAATVLWPGQLSDKQYLELEDAIRSNNIQVLKNGLTKLKQTQAKAVKLLFYSVYKKNKDAVKVFIKAGIPIDSQDARGWTPLHEAVYHKDKEFALFLLDLGARSDIRTTHMIERRNDHVIFYENTLPLHFAALNNDAEMAGLLLGRMKKDVLPSLAHDLFVMASIYRNTEVLKFIISQCPDVNITDDMGWTLLHWAVHDYNAEEVLQALIDKGADVNFKSTKEYKNWHRGTFPAGSTPLDIARLSGKKLTMEFLLRNGAQQQPGKTVNAYLPVYTRSLENLTVSPQGILWTVRTDGTLYSTADITQYWDQSKVIHGTGSRTLFPFSFYGIIFFDSNTAVVYGNCKSSVHRTTDNGKTWKEIDLGDLVFIYNGHARGNGEAWIGGSSGDIYYTRDFGLKWNKKNSPFDSQTRMNSIFMSDSQTGIAGALGNVLYLTFDNWTTSRKIPTPLDQKAAVPPKKYCGDYRIKKTVVWNNYFLVKQCDEVFHSAKDNISWHPFMERLTNFTIDAKTGRMFGVNKKRKIFMYSGGTTPELKLPRDLEAAPAVIVAYDGCLYVIDIDFYVYKISPDHFTRERFLVKF